MGVRDRKPTQEFQAALTLDGVRHRLNGQWIVEISPGRHVSQQEMMSDEAHKSEGLVLVESQSRCHRGGELGSHVTVVTPTRLADVMQESGHQQQVRPRHIANLIAGAGRRLDEVAVDPVEVNGIGLRRGPHGLPLGDESADQSLPVQGLPHRYQPIAGAEQRHQGIARWLRPRTGHGRRLAGQSRHGGRG